LQEPFPRACLVSKFLYSGLLALDSPVKTHMGLSH
ncbi:uncharacterized protein METZ01_LOCUS147955, partial [marine metagenome]